jgi:hypothetical protein
MVIDYGRWCEKHPEIVILGGSLYKKIPLSEAGEYLGGMHVRCLTGGEMEEFKRDCCDGTLTRV